MNANEKVQFEAEFKRKFEDELAKALGSEPEKEVPQSDVTDVGFPGTKITCDAIGGIPQKLVLAFGKDNIKSVREQELSSKLKFAPVYFSEGECESLREKLGIKEDGIYLLNEDKQRVKRWKDKKRAPSPRSKFLSTCLSDKSKGENAPQRMVKCSEEWKKTPH